MIPSLYYNFSSPECFSHKTARFSIKDSNFISYKFFSKNLKIKELQYPYHGILFTITRDSNKGTPKFSFPVYKDIGQSFYSHKSDWDEAVLITCRKPGKSPGSFYRRIAACLAEESPVFQAQKKTLRKGKQHIEIPESWIKEISLLLCLNGLESICPIEWTAYSQNIDIRNQVSMIISYAGPDITTIYNLHLLYPSHSIESLAKKSPDEDPTSGKYPYFVLCKSKEQAQSICEDITEQGVAPVAAHDSEWIPATCILYLNDNSRDNIKAVESTLHKYDGSYILKQTRRKYCDV